MCRRLANRSAAKERVDNCSGVKQISKRREATLPALQSTSK
jgi:hypothetical protein